MDHISDEYERVIADLRAQLAKEHERKHTLDGVLLVRGGRSIAEQLLTQIKLKGDLRAIDVFEALDGDSDGYICKAEWLFGLAKLGPELPRPWLEEAFAKADVNCSGSIDFGEFEQFLETANETRHEELRRTTPKAKTPAVYKVRAWLDYLWEHSILRTWHSRAGLIGAHSSILRAPTTLPRQPVPSKHTEPHTTTLFHTAKAPPPPEAKKRASPQRRQANVLAALASSMGVRSNDRWFEEANEANVVGAGQSDFQSMMQDRASGFGHADLDKDGMLDFNEVTGPGSGPGLEIGLGLGATVARRFDAH